MASWIAVNGHLRLARGTLNFFLAVTPLFAKQEEERCVTTLKTAAYETSDD